MSDIEQTQAAWIAYLKSKPQLTVLLTNGGANEIRETQWQGDEFAYPAIRVSVDYFPSINGCGPDDIDVQIDVFSEEKSSKQASHIASVLQSILHKHPFTSLGVHFPMVNVQTIKFPFKDIYAWKVTIPIKGLVV
ncbi:MAG TPA: hypothetical protein VFM18_04090 [Methanosarcina sp.]|nr:hypothetical protein [Methanosarcina sp.]